GVPAIAEQDTELWIGFVGLILVDEACLREELEAVEIQRPGGVYIDLSRNTSRNILGGAGLVDVNPVDECGRHVLRSEERRVGKGGGHMMMERRLGRRDVCGQIW